MKKRLLILIFILTLVFIPLRVNADSNIYKSSCALFSELPSIENPWQNKKYYVNNGVGETRDGIDVMCFLTVNENAGLCANIGKTTVDGSSVTRYSYDGVLNPNTNIKNNSGTRLTGKQLENLQDLMANGYQFKFTYSTIQSEPFRKSDMPAKYIAMQVLVWEVMEGGRTSFDYVTNGYAPNVYNGDGTHKSAYQTIVEPNTKVLAAYKQIIQDVYEAQNPTSASAFDKKYILRWDKNRKTYIKEIPNLGKYTSCKATSDKVKVTVSGTTAVVETTQANLQFSPITCSYAAGNGSYSDNTFYYYDFPNGLCTSTNGCQSILHGVSLKVYEKTFHVESEQALLKVFKEDNNNNEVQGAEFTIKYNADGSSKKINLATKTNPSIYNSIQRSGDYTISETKVPDGYSKINDFIVTIDAEASKVTSCSNQTKNSNGEITHCVNKQVEVTYDSSGHIIFKIVNVPKNFKIAKVDDNNKPVVGAGFTFKEYNTNKVVKFKKVNGVYTYDANGTITEIKSSSSNTYKIALLPAGVYKLIETSVPFPYLIPSNDEYRTKIVKMESNGSLFVFDTSQDSYVLTSEIIIKNLRSTVTINKTGNGKNLEGVKFFLYDGNKQNVIKCSQDQNGIYNYVENQSSIDSNNFITNSKGNITIKDLPTGTYYLREVETISPFILPEGDAAYTKIKVEVEAGKVYINDSSSSHIINISNSPFMFNFYKVNEDGEYLSGGKYKVQKYDNSKDRYVDIKVSSVDNDGSTYNPKSNVFKPDTNGNTKFTLTNGIATFISMEPSSRYRIVELEAPSGYEKSEKNDTVEVTIDRYGNASGMLTLINERISKIEGDTSAELIVNISTGMDRVSYSLIIGGIIVLIGCSLFIIRRMDKKKK